MSHGIIDNLFAFVSSVGYTMGMLNERNNMIAYQYPSHDRIYHDTWSNLKANLKKEGSRIWRIRRGGVVPVVYTQNVLNRRPDYCEVR